ncbi:benzoate/H(+) symporter BenE family transporter [Gordonia jinhuaensis]|uniref:benzoate/H(+) symporter BenE family transporter n=1 Tax=Gordonia jinhuaensis TaxID=1517702 RepID=UPI0016641EB2|nr:benzoate/H(+) symporter BenE family transporter [Gordonia jinhuaensis]
MSAADNRVTGRGDSRPAVSVAIPIVAGIICALVGYTSSFAVVLAGLRGVGASPVQAASGLLAVTVCMALASIVLSYRFRIPITSAWSTPGAALLAATGAVAGGWPAAVGAFLITGVLFVVTGLWSGLSSLIGRIPVPVAQAMLAGVLLPLCIAPATSLAHHPAAVAPVLLTWLVLVKAAPRWAVPGAFLAAMIVIAITASTGDVHLSASELIPRLEFVAPSWGWQALVGIAIPLYVVTMAAQNIPGVAVMKTFDYEVPWRPSMLVTGLGTVLGAVAGGHAINLAAISAALAAGPDAGPDRSRRWIAAVSAGVSYLVIAPLSAALSALVLAAGEGVLEAVAGVALLGAFAGAISGAFADPHTRTAAGITFVIAASGVSLLGIGSAFWALLIGIIAFVILRPDSDVGIRLRRLVGPLVGRGEVGRADVGVGGHPVEDTTTPDQRGGTQQ